MKKLITLLIILLFAAFLQSYEMNTLVDSPTAGILQKGEAEISTKLYKNNLLLEGTSFTIIRNC